MDELPLWHWHTCVELLIILSNCVFSASINSSALVNRKLAIDQTAIYESINTWLIRPSWSAAKPAGAVIALRKSCLSSLQLGRLFAASPAIPKVQGPPAFSL